MKKFLAFYFSFLVFGSMTGMASAQEVDTSPDFDVSSLQGQIASFFALDVPIALERVGMNLNLVTPERFYRDEADVVAERELEQIDLSVKYADGMIDDSTFQTQNENLANNIADKVSELEVADSASDVDVSDSMLSEIESVQSQTQAVESDSGIQIIDSAGNDIGTQAVSESMTAVISEAQTGVSDGGASAAEISSEGGGGAVGE